MATVRTLTRDDVDDVVQRIARHLDDDAERCAWVNPALEIELLRRALADSRAATWIALDGADGLFLEITGCAHLFGGEEAMLADMQARVERLGFAARAALADTPGAAWALVRFGIPRDRATCVAPVGGARAALASLPIAALRLGSAETFDLGRLGLRRIGDLYDLPRPPLAASLLK